MQPRKALLGPVENRGVKGFEQSLFKTREEAYSKRIVKRHFLSSIKPHLIKSQEGQQAKLRPKGFSEVGMNVALYQKTKNQVAGVVLLGKKRVPWSSKLPRRKDGAFLEVMNFRGCSL